MGLLEDTAINSESTSPNRQLIDHLEKAFNIKVTESSLRARFLTNHVRNIDEAIEAFRWLGLLEDDDTVNDKETKACSTSSATTVRDAVCQLFEEKMKFADGEKDMVAMFHSVVGEMPDGTIETHDSHLLAFGLANSLSAMSATVGYTTAAATEMLLDGTVQQKAIASGKPLTGVIIPTSSVVYEYLLNSIESFGITWTEDVKIKRPTK